MADTKGKTVYSKHPGKRTNSPTIYGKKVCYCNIGGCGIEFFICKGKSRSVTSKNSILPGNHTSSEQNLGIAVGKHPSAIGVFGDTIYVANAYDDTVSVIDGQKNIKGPHDISVGIFPVAIGVDDMD